MDIALNRRGDGTKGHRAPEIHHLAHRRHLGDVQRDIDGGVAIKRLKGAAPLTGQRFGQLCSACDWIETLHFEFLELQWNRQLNRIQRQLGIGLERHLAASREIHGKQERHGRRWMMKER